MVTGYAGDAQLNLFFFLPVQFWGIWSWGENLLEEQAVNEEEGGSKTVQSRQMQLWHWLVCIVLAGGITVAFYYEIPVFAVAISGVYYFEGKDVPRSLDSIVNALSMIAQVLSIWRFSEQWYFWLAIDVLQIAMFTGVAGYGIVINVLVMWILFTLNALSGLYAWHVRYYFPETSRLSEISANGDGSSSKQLVNHHGNSEGDVECGTGTTVAGYHKVQGHEKDLDDAHCTTSRDPKAFGNAAGGFTPPLSPLHQRDASQPRRGLVIGKFWPFHRGHQHLIDTAVAQCQEVYVILCDRPYHQPSASISQAAIRETCPTVYTMVIRDAYDPNDSQLWAELTKAWCGFVPDRVFTSEHYGTAYVRYLGAPCEHVLVDLERARFPVSGTAVRAEPYKYWSLIPRAMRRYYCRRIVLVGAESTGKTTLAQQLAAHFQAPFVAEYGREFCEELLLKRQQQQGQEMKSDAVVASGSDELEEFTFSDDDFETIARRQCQRENDAAMDSNTGLIVCDTDAWATLRWFTRYQHKAPTESLLKLQQQHARSIAPEAVLYVLTDVAGSVFVQDGLRDGKHVRDAMHRDFVAAFQRDQLPYVTVAGTFDTRFASALAQLSAHAPSFTVPA